jgi:hypothetical protein
VTLVIVGIGVGVVGLLLQESIKQNITKIPENKKIFSFHPSFR